MDLADKILKAKIEKCEEDMQELFNKLDEMRSTCKHNESEHFVSEILQVEYDVCTVCGEILNTISIKDSFYGE